MVFKTIKTIWNDKENETKSLKITYVLPFCIVFVISIQYESINLTFCIEIDDKNDKKGELSVFYHFFIVSTIFSVSY